MGDPEWVKGLENISGGLDDSRQVKAYPGVRGL